MRFSSAIQKLGGRMSASPAQGDKIQYDKELTCFVINDTVLVPMASLIEIEIEPVVKASKTDK